MKIKPRLYEFNLKFVYLYACAILSYLMRICGEKSRLCEIREVIMQVRQGDDSLKQLQSLLSYAKTLQVPSCLI